MEIYDWFKARYQKRLGIAFCSALVFGFLTHMYKITNTLMNHDSLYLTYGEQNMTSSGRWFLSIACGISSYFDLPWINGILALFYIAVTAAIVECMFDISNPVVICLASGMLAVFPAVTVTFFYGFTVDGYMLAMLLATLSAYFLSILGGYERKRGILFFIASVVLLCLSCGIYQAYFSFGLVLSLSSFIMTLLEHRLAKKECLKWMAIQLLAYALAMLLYVLVLKFCLRWTGTNLTDYQGISSAGVSVGTILAAFGRIKRGIYQWVLGYGTWGKDRILYASFNILFLLFALYAGIEALRKSRMAKEPISLCCVLCSVMALPFSVWILFFVSPGVRYHRLMLQSLAVLYILGLVLAEKWLTTKAKNLMGILTVALIFYFMIQANIGYYQLQRCDRVSYMTAIEMLSRIHQLDCEGDSRLMVVGNMDVQKTYSVQLVGNRTTALGGMLDYQLLEDEIHVLLYLNEQLDYKIDAVSAEHRESIMKNSQLRTMPCWPKPDSVKMIDGVVVIKLSD